MTPLCDEAHRYRAAIPSPAGIHVTEQAGLVHGWLRARHRSPHTDETFARILAPLSEALRRA
ncbi:hypothetical protein D2T31_17615 [Sinirhodobacter populi]|uniref:Uncharacterized protein n=1 Tax=Paenirhodobacter populi TaxID=2306993 RepID=A0A443K2W4_9RHOB|nr:hypothetical protein [Sinirhodobacter populi]RWR27099.1 hypothetical protein D2T31_17615 [Sinirhodobacter populi]